MRLTTKIITSIILSIFILSLLHIIAYSFTDRKNFKWPFTGHSIKLPQTDRTGMNIKPYKVIVLESEESIYSYYFANENEGLFIQPAPTSDEENKLFIPEVLNDFITTKTNNDTLTVKINFDELMEKYGTIDEALKKCQISDTRYGISVSGFNLYLHTSNVNVINTLNDLQTRISNIKAESIKIYSTGDVVIDSCKVNMIEPVLEPSYRKLTIENSSIKMLNLDLDRMGTWNISNCNIETSNFTGSRRYNNITLSQPEMFGRINWLPKNKDAELHITLKGDPAQIRL